MHFITLSNNKIKEIVKLHQKKYRDISGLYIVEGIKAVEELLNSDNDIKEIFASKEVKMSKKANISHIDEKQMKKISTTTTVCEVLAVVQKKNTDINDFAKLSRIALFENISDPGNLGTVIRSAAAFGIEGIILLGNCVDLYSSKVIRSCAGNFFKTKIIEINDYENLKEYFKNFKIIATSLSEDNNITFEECKKNNKYIIMFGSEAKGISSELTKIADYNIRLNMLNNVESLNLGVSASIVFYELNK